MSAIVVLDASACNPSSTFLIQTIASINPDVVVIPRGWAASNLYTDYDKEALNTAMAGRVLITDRRNNSGKIML